MSHILRKHALKNVWNSFSFWSHPHSPCCNLKGHWSNICLAHRELSGSSLCVLLSFSSWLIIGAIIVNFWATDVIFLIRGCQKILFKSRGHFCQQESIEIGILGLAWFMRPQSAASDLLNVKDNCPGQCHKPMLRIFFFFIFLGVAGTVSIVCREWERANAIVT